MEKTIGKRIAENRKRLGLTQDALAEQLGVTAQAVSKWENDQSCPDITMLPKLAEIFGISTDELLGCPVQRVLQGEVVDETAGEETEKDKNHWELDWDPGKRIGIAFAVLVLLVGGLLLAATLCHWEAGFWSILWPSALLVYGIFGFTKRFSFFRMGCAVFGGYFLVSNLGLWQLEGDLVFPAILVLLGISLLVDALSKPKRSSFKVLKNGKEVYTNGNNGKMEGSHREEGTHFTSSLSFGDALRRAELPVLSSGEISVNFGEMTLDLSGCGTVTEDCRIEASCSFGVLTLLVPKKWQVLPHSDTAFASLDIQGEPSSDPEGRIVLMGNVSFGEICVQYV